MTEQHEHVLAEVFALVRKKFTSVHKYKCVRNKYAKLTKVRMSLDHNNVEAPTLFIITEYLLVSQCMQLNSEIMQSESFRVYKIQGNDEPRLHILYHEKSASVNADSDDIQYGYRQV